MKILRVKSILFSLLAVLMVSVFMISCEQEVIVEQVEEVSLAERISQDADVIAFVVASERLEIAIDKKIEDNQAAYDRYVAAENFEAIRELLNYDTDILPLEIETAEKYEIVLKKYPNIEEVEGITIGFQSEGAALRVPWECEGNYIKYHACIQAKMIWEGMSYGEARNECWWLWCASSHF